MSLMAGECIMKLKQTSTIIIITMNLICIALCLTRLQSALLKKNKTADKDQKQQ